MHEISPVLSGKFDQSDYTPASLNIATGGASNTPDPQVASASGAVAAASDTTAASSSTSQTDSRRYTKFDRTASNAGEMTNFTFGDFLDMLNPLQHVPVASSVYRSAENETINPVSRVVGDMLYGGLMGPASILVGGLSAVSNSMMESETGKDMTGTVVAALFGDEKTKAGDNNVQVASAQTATPTPAPAPASPAPASTALAQAQTPPTNAPAGGKQYAAAVGAPAPDGIIPTVASPAAATSTATASSQTFYPLTHNKLPYGGVMAPPMSNMQDQNTMMALSQNPHAVRIGNTIYAGRLPNGPLPMAPSAAVPKSSLSAASQANAAASAAANPAALAPAAKPTLSNSDLAAMLMSSGNMMPGSFMSKPSNPMAALAAGADPNMPNALPPDLMNNAIMMKALSQYNSVAGGMGTLGATPRPGLSD